MNKKEILTIILLICVIFSLQAVVAADSGSNSTDSNVLSVDNDVSSYALPSSNTDTLAEVANADSFTQLAGNLSGASATLTKNYTYKDGDSFSNGITIDHDIIIEGSGNIIIDANHKSRVFNITNGATVTLKGITFINGNADGNGGSISTTGKLTLDNCKFINSTATGNGGAIYVATGSTHNSITDCTFTNNTAKQNGGAIYFSTGSANCKIDSCTFDNNEAKRSAGAVFWIGNYGELYNSNFTNNTARGGVSGLLLTMVQTLLVVLVVQSFGPVLMVKLCTVTSTTIMLLNVVEQYS